MLYSVYLLDADMDDAEKKELEQLGHHGIGNRLNRDQEADLSLQTEYRNKINSWLNLGKSSSRRSVGERLHPLVGLLSGSALLILGACGIFLGISSPADRIPKELRPWPSVIADVVRAAAHHSRYESKYDMTFRYKVAGTSYWFEEGSIPTEIHLSEVKYDPKAPSHYYRVPLQGEGWSGLLFALIPCTLGYILICSAIEKWRSGDRSYSVILSVIFLVGLMAVGLAAFTLYFTPKSPSTPYKVARLKDPG